MNSENKLPCLFCKWIKTKYKDVKKEGRLLNDPDKDSYLAVLDEDPKVAGHTLIISMIHYDDITKLEYDNLFQGVIKWAEIFQGVIKWANKIKEKLNKRPGKDEVKKVYVLTMCDHYSDEELRKSKRKDHNEHLHFHLVPRYNSDENIKGEEVLIRGVPLKSEELKSKKLKSKNQREIEEIYKILKEQKE